MSFNKSKEEIKTEAQSTHQVVKGGFMVVFMKK